DGRLREAGKARLAAGRLSVVSLLTGDRRDLVYGLLHMGDHNLTGGVRGFRGDEAYDATWREVREAFERADFPRVIRLLDRHF
ncbi:DUF3536 domain-containing protein, partial [Salmonella enterica]|uniref:DUF3536 domain-containing protein n=1 Tax=Salmonella enterica TaxID=28901 RepID=UPI0032995C3D